jgi:glycosyltransferase involved in cell wall biosynthesis
VTSRPLVSVVLPVRNGERFLGEALDSVLTQEYEPLELIVVDDGSTDRSGDIARACGAHVIRQESEGLSGARNAGIAAAHGELIAFIDADDVWLPGKVERQVEYLLEHRDIGFVYSSWTILLEPGASVPPQFAGDWRRPRAGYLPSALIVRREVLDQVGLFDPTYAIGEDVDWLARANEAGVRHEVLPDVLVRYRIHEANLIHDAPRLKDAVFRVLRESAVRKRTTGRTE